MSNEIVWSKVGSTNEQVKTDLKNCEKFLDKLKDERILEALPKPVVVDLTKPLYISPQTKIIIKEWCMNKKGYSKIKRVRNER